jgi:phosphoglucosamine mutase
MKKERAESFEPPRFGTDGLRGRAGEPPLDPETLRRVGAALGIHLQRRGPEQKRVVIGNDGRDSAPWILDALAQGLAATEVATIDVDLCTTPALAFLARTEPFAAGVMISASHNPAADNGIKIFDAEGRKLSDEAEREIEQLTVSTAFTPMGEVRTKSKTELLGKYVDWLGNYFAGLDLSGATVVIDAANGGGAALAPTVLRAFGADVVAVACEPDGTNINQDCGALAPANLVPTVLASGAVLGICLDGDGDRCIFVDDRGQIADGDAILATLAPRMLQRGRLPKSTAVATVMSNLGLHHALAQAGIQVVTTPVGDRHLAARMRSDGLTLGAEQSGHVLIDIGDGVLVGDGLFTALHVLAIDGVREHGTARLFASFERFPQKLVNVRVEQKPPLAEIQAIGAAIVDAERRLGTQGRVLLRYSGTENLCRVMVEARDRELMEAITAQLVEIVTKELGGDPHP